MAIQGKANLEAEGVTATETAGLYACFHQFVPKTHCEVVRTVDLKAILASVASAADDYVLAIEMVSLEVVESDFLKRKR